MGFFSNLYNAAAGKVSDKVSGSVRSKIASLQSAAETFDRKYSLQSKGVNMWAMITSDLVLYALMIADSDYDIDYDEIRSINKMLGLDLSYSQYQSLIREMGKSWESFSREVPLTMRILIPEIAMSSVVDARMFAKHLIEIYDDLGFIVSAADGDVDSRELINKQNYVAMLKRYASRF